MQTQITIPAHKVPNFGTTDDRLRNGTWEIALIGGVHRDCGALDRSNRDVIYRRLADVDPEQEYHDTLACRHWAVGWYDHLIVDVSCDAVMAVVRDCADSLADYPVLCEDDLGEREYNERWQEWDYYACHELRSQLCKELAFDRDGLTEDTLTDIFEEASSELLSDLYCQNPGEELYDDYGAHWDFDPVIHYVESVLVLLQICATRSPLV